MAPGRPVILIKLSLGKGRVKHNRARLPSS